MSDTVLADIFQWFAQFASDARIWVTQTAQAHPLWCFPIAFAVAFTESFVGLSFIIPGFAVLVAGMSEPASLRRSSGLTPSWLSRPLPQNGPYKSLNY